MDIFIPIDLLYYEFIEVIHRYKAFIKNGSNKILEKSFLHDKINISILRLTKLLYII